MKTSYQETIGAWRDERKAEMLAMRKKGQGNRQIALAFECSTQWVNKMIGPEGIRKKNGAETRKV